MAKRDEQLYYLVNVISARCYCHEYFDSDKIEQRNDWLEKYGSPNIRWLTPEKFERLEREIWNR